MFDCHGAFLKVHEIKFLDKSLISRVVKLNKKCLIPHNQPPMLNINGRLENILRGTPVDFHGTFIFEWGNLSLNPLLQLAKKKTCN